MKVFDLQGNNTNFISEMLAGLTSFVTISYRHVYYLLYWLPCYGLVG